jgi:paraquat-inducible protein B
MRVVVDCVRNMGAKTEKRTPGKARKMRRRFLILLILPLLVWACKDIFKIKIRYDQIAGLKEGDRVVFEKNDIGAVTGVSYTVDGDYLAEVGIKKSFANAVTENSHFYVIDDPMREGDKAIEVVRTRSGGTPLKNGTIVEGSTKSSVQFGGLPESLEKGFEGFQEQLEEVFEGLSAFPESKEFKDLQEELEGLGKAMSKSTGSVKERLEKEVLPRLKEQIEKLRKRMEKLGREKEVEPLEMQLKRMEEM